MRLDPDGAQLFPAAFAPDRIAALETALAGFPADRPGTRLPPIPGFAGLVERLGAESCPAAAGDLWLYATPILHASARAAAACFSSSTAPTTCPAVSNGADSKGPYPKD